ncbi:helix-turn-helix transcriptional regulator [Persicimonas caeni]|uniref:Helix-turn-helix transcriptional regulator n=1 Tax=Persicimonas caeni TaxID=2292766 RepID=A0A4Y6PX76_PERCE|nr:helix-turn-helix transcriptional regulator [Persicimonas caeni]QDG52934.1 helix-turn-helix transcriptional regulator [Persicimonas caeni]QED34156.1 helix-turn-helix transcriptional regulator [Persicimonas caeni]
MSNESGTPEQLTNDGGQRDAVARGLAVLSVPLVPSKWPDALTDAEREVATFLIRGRTYTEIGRQRGTSRHTVSSQVSSMLSKLDVSSTSELIAALARYNRCHET